MTLEEKLAMISPEVRKVQTLPSLWEVKEERPLNAKELEKIDYVEVVSSPFNDEEMRGEVHFKDGSKAGKTIKFVSSSDVRLGEHVPLQELRFVHKHYVGEEEVQVTDVLHFKRVKVFSFDNPFGL